MVRWKEVEGYPNYMVSDTGQVFNRTRNYLLKCADDGHGYKAVALCQSGSRKTKLIHRLVCEAFLGPIPEGYEVNHKDEDKGNNRLDNLELLTHKENMRYGTRTQRATQTNRQWRKGMRKLVGKPVLQYTLDGTLVCRWDSMADAGDHGFDYSSIGKCCRGRRKSHKGYRWTYA